MIDFINECCCLRGFFKNRGGISPVCALLLQRTSEEQIKMKIAIHTVLGCVFHCKYCCIVFLVNCALRRFLLFEFFSGGNGGYSVAEEFERCIVFIFI